MSSSAFACCPSVPRGGDSCGLAAIPEITADSFVTLNQPLFSNGWFLQWELQLPKATLLARNTHKNAFMLYIFVHLVLF